MWRHPKKVDCPNHREMMYHTRHQKPWISWVLLTFHGSTGVEAQIPEGFLSHSLFVPLIAVSTLQLITLTRRELVSVKGFSRSIL